MVKNKERTLLKNQYYTPHKAGAFGGVDVLTRALSNKKIKSTQVSSFLKDQETYSLHRQVRRNFPRRRVQVGGRRQQFQCDLVDMHEHVDGAYKWILMCIDVFTKKAWAFPLKRKNAEEMLAAMKELLENLQVLPAKLQTDKGKEFLNKAVQDYLKSKHVEWFCSEDDYIKAGVVERLNRTIKDKMWRHMTWQRDHKWVKILPEIIESYNNTYHSSIKMSPEEGDLKENEEEVRENLYGEGKGRLKEERKDDKGPFSVGDLVRVSKHALTFDRGYQPNWMQEVMKVSESLPTSPVVYRIVDLKGEEVEGTFYRQELQKVEKLPTTFDIEKVLQRRKGEVLVKWKGYPSKFNEWIPSSHLTRGQRRN